MRCSTCNKWPQLEQADPEVDVNLLTSEINGTVRIALTCAECGDEIKQHTFDVEIDVSEHLDNHDCPEANTGVGWSVEENDIEATTRQHPPNARRRTTFYGASVNFKLQCNCDEVDVEIPWQDEIKASQMEEL